MTRKPQRTLGDGAKGDIDNPEGEATIQPGLVESNEKEGATLTEQVAADAKAQAKAAEKTENKE